MLDNNWRLVAAIASCAFLVALAGAPRPSIAQASSQVPEPPEAPAAILPVTADLSVRATATFEVRPDEPSLTYVAKVIVNGTPIGQTPYEGVLVPGRYLLEIEGEGMRATTTVDVGGGKKYNISARFYIQMTEAEKSARRAAELAAAQAARAEEDARWREILAAWQETDAAARGKRKPYVVSGALLLLAGVGLSIGGIAAESKAQGEHDSYLAHKEKWGGATDPVTIEREKNAMIADADARDRDNGMGVAFLVVGGAAIVAGIVVLSVMPKRPAKPERGSADEKAPSFSIAPLVAPDLAGLSVDVRF